jgi:hypothetical protein
MIFGRNWNRCKQGGNDPARPQPTYEALYSELEAYFTATENVCLCSPDAALKASQDRDRTARGDRRYHENCNSGFEFPGLVWVVEHRRSRSYRTHARLPPPRA